MKFFKKNFLKKGFYGHVEYSFDNPAESFLIRKVLAKTAWKMFQFKIGLIENSFDKPFGNFLLK